jgi:hypothetical protein
MLHRVVWYTSMVGKQSSLKALKAVLAQEGIPRNRVFSTTLKQGLTHRWCLAWTFSDSAAQAYERQLQMQRDRQRRRESTSGPDGGDAVTSAGRLKASFECSIALSALQETRLPADVEVLITTPYAGELERIRGQGGDLARPGLWEVVERVVAAVHATHAVLTQASSALEQDGRLLSLSPSADATVHAGESQPGKVVLSLREIELTDSAASDQVQTVVLCYDAWTVRSGSAAVDGGSGGSVEEQTRVTVEQGYGGSLEAPPSAAQRAYSVRYTVSVASDLAPSAPVVERGVGQITSLHEYGDAPGAFGR